jgi:hypothetical protein
MSDRHVCTKEDPWDESKGRATHPDATIEDDGDVYVDTYDCPHCRKRFKVEVAE